jgi:hypothetical protein
MKSRPTQLGVRENTASSRQHASRLAVSPSPSESERPSVNTLEDKQSSAHVFPTAERFNLSLTEPECGATGGEREDTSDLAIDLNGNNE